MARSGWDSTNMARASSRMYEGTDLGSMTPWPRPLGGNGGVGEGFGRRNPPSRARSGWRAARSRSMRLSPARSAMDASLWNASVESRSSSEPTPALGANRPAPGVPDG